MADILVTIIGAGFAGVGMAAQLKRRIGLDCSDFAIYEKNLEVGGVWSQNTYPNLSCDVPSEFYSFSFFQNPDWSEKFASQPEILAYIKDCIAHYTLQPALHLGQECLSASWSEHHLHWLLQFRDVETGKEYTQTSKFVMTAVGAFSRPTGLRGLPALENFGGPVFHTSQWREIDFDDKAVFVIGHGCSANQVIPWILAERKPTSLTQLVRSEQWIAPKANFKHSVWFQRVLRYIPFAMRLYRLRTAWQLDAFFPGFRKTSAGERARNATTSGIRQYMKSEAASEYHDALIPDYPFGSKRPIMDHGYLASTNRDNFHLVKSTLPLKLASDRRTLIDGEGRQHPTDVIILANGFEVQDFLAPMTIKGVSGADLRQRWQDQGGAEAYMGANVSGFPNLFLIGGPNSAPSLNSTLHGIECSTVYIARLLQGLKRNGSLQSTTVEARPEAEKDFNAYVQREIGKLIYSSDISTWYINKETGKNTLVWPGTQMSFWWSRCVKPIAWKDFDVSR